MKRIIHDFLSNEERASAVLIAGATGIVLDGFIVAVAAILFMR